MATETVPQNAEEAHAAGVEIANKIAAKTGGATTVNPEDSPLVATVSLSAAKRAALDVTVEQAALARTLPILARAAGGRTTLPVLNCVLLRAEAGPSGGALADGTLHLEASDLEIAMQTTISCQVAHEGALCVPISLLSNWVAKLPAGPVRLQGSAESLAAQAGKARTSIRGIDSEEFPPLAALGEGAAEWTMPAAGLRRAIDTVAFAAATDLSRPVLTAVHLALAPGKAIRAEAADGFRLALLRQIDGTLAPDGGKPLSYLVPAKPFASLGRYLPSKNGEGVEIRCAADANASGVRFTLPAAADNSRGPLTVAIRLLEGQFPDLEQVIPKAFTTTATVDRAALALAVRRADLFARDAAHVLNLAFADGAVTLTAGASGVGDSNEEVACEIEGDAAAFSVSAEYLLEVFEALPGERVRLGINGPLTPVKIASGELPEYVHIVMPMHTVR